MKIADGLDLDEEQTYQLLCAAGLPEVDNNGDLPANSHRDVDQLRRRIADDVTLVVQGSASMAGAPDLLELLVTYRPIQTSMDSALAEANRIGSKLRSAVLKTGASTAPWTGATTVRNIGIDREGTNSSNRYEVATRIALRWERDRVPDVSVVQIIESAVIGMGAVVEAGRWTFSADHPARLDACAQAARVALRKAEVYASGLRARVGRIVRVTELAEGHSETRDDPNRQRADTLDVVAAVEVAFQIESTRPTPSIDLLGPTDDFARAPVGNRNNPP